MTHPTSRTYAADKGDLQLWRVWYVWFAVNSQYAPVKIGQTLEYGFDGERYPIERQEGQPPFAALYEASDFVDFGDSIVFPKTGSQSRYLPDLSTVQSFDANVVVEELLETGKSVDRMTHLLQETREWHVLELEYLDSETDLWFGPPADVLVMDNLTDVVRIEGKTDAETKELLGLLPTGAEALKLEPRGAGMTLLILGNALLVGWFPYLGSSKASTGW